MEAWEETRIGRGGLVLVESESGGGKTRLLEELCRQAVAPSSPVYWGQGLALAAQRPFQVLVPIAEQIAATTQEPHPLAMRLREKLGKHAEVLCTALPQLTGLLGSKIATTTLGPEDFGQYRNVRALALFLEALGDVDEPALVILDDCQWADEYTIQ